MIGDNKPNNLSKEIHGDHDLDEWYGTSWSPSLKQRFQLGAWKTVHILMEGTFKFIGLSRKGYQNALDLEVEDLALSFPNLPEEFNGTRVLFLSDFHLGNMKELSEVIIAKIQDLKVDFCLLGGDYRHCCTHPARPFLKELENIISCISSSNGIYGVLGNHDGPELIPAIERMGVKMLINESIQITRGSKSINLVGVDECNLFRRHDLARAFQGVHKSNFNLFVAHSPDLYREAQERGTDLYLCGHTHQGQIRFPGIGPLLTFTGAPRRFASGGWKYNDMIGYTGAGLGVVAASVRFRCPPKVLVLTLKKGES